MIQVTIIEPGKHSIKGTIRLTHPRANLMTINIGHDAHCNFPLTMEIAFSLGHAFLTDPLPDFAQWGSIDHDGRVMSYYDVPIAHVAKFLNIYAEKINPI